MDAILYKRKQNTGDIASDFEKVNLDATNFTVTFGNQTRNLGAALQNFNDYVLWKTTTSNTYPRLYYVSADGNTQGVWGFTSSVVAGTIVQRDDNGHVKVATPTSNEDAASKSYVDNKFVTTGDESQEIDGVKTFTGYVTVYDDGSPAPSVPRPNNALGFVDPDLYIYSTGFTVLDAEDSDQYHCYSFPDHSGTFAMTKDIGLTLLDLRGYNI